MTANLNSSKTEFLLIGLRKQLDKTQNSSLNTTHSACNLGFIFDDHLTFSDQISAISKVCYYHIRQVRCIRPYLDSNAARTIATSTVHSKLDYCNSLYYNLHKSQMTRLQQIQNSLALAVVKAPKCCHITPILHYLQWLKTTERIEYKLLSLTYKVLTTTQPPYLHNLISVQPPRNTRSSSHVTLARPPTSSSLRITDRSFRYALPCLWNQLPCSLRQPYSSPSVCDLPLHAPATPSYSLNLPFSPSIIPCLSLPAQYLPFSQIIPTIDFLLASGLIPRLYDWTISSEHLGFYRASYAMGVVILSVRPSVRHTRAL